MSDLKDIAKLIASGDMDHAAAAFVNNAFDKLVESRSEPYPYHNSYTSAIQQALEVAEDAGYTYDEDEYFNKVATGPRKPGVGETNVISLGLYKDGKPARRTLEFQVYGMESGSYELNVYIS